MAQTNDGKSDSSVSYTPVAPLNKEETIDAIFDEFMNGNPPFADENAKVQAQAFVNYLKPKLKALLDSHIREAYNQGYDDRTLEADHELEDAIREASKEQLKFLIEISKPSGLIADDILKELLATLDNKEESNEQL